MKEIKSLIYSIAGRKSFLIPLIITAVLAYGFKLTNPIVFVDDTALVDRYYDGSYLLAAGRAVMVFFAKILPVFDYRPFFTNFFGLLLLMISSVIWCALFKNCSKAKLHPLSYTIFSCLFISYPLIGFIFNYSCGSVAVGFGYLFTALSLYYANSYLKSKQNRQCVFSALMSFFALSLYESFASVYLLGVSAVLILKFFFDDNYQKDIKTSLYSLVKFLFPVIAGTIAYFAVSIPFRILASVPNLAENSISWLNGGIISTFLYLMKSMIGMYAVNALVYFPLSLFLIVCFVWLAATIIVSAKRKSSTLLLLGLITIVFLFSLSFILGEAASYRMCQSFALFIGFFAILLMHLIIFSNLNKQTKTIAISLVFLVILYQTSFLNTLFYATYVDYTYAKNTITDIARELNSNYDISKPVIFVGKLPASQYYLSITSVNSSSWNGKLFNWAYDTFHNRPAGSTGSPYGRITSIVNWGVRAFGPEPNAELLKFLSMEGYSYEQGTAQMMAQAIILCDYKPAWPHQNSIFDVGDYIVVFLGK